MNQENENGWMTRRQLLYTMAAGAGTLFAPAGPLFADSIVESFARGRSFSGRS